MPENWELLKICAENASLQEDYANAENYMWQAIEAAAGTKSVLKVALCMDYLGDLYLKMGKFSDAEALFNDCLEKQISVLGLDHPELAPVLGKLSICQTFQNRLSEAEDSLKQSILINLIAYGANHPQTTWAVRNMQSLYARQGRTFSLQDVTGWGNVPAPQKKVEEALICKTCHRPYTGAQCTNCTQMRLAAIPTIGLELERIHVVCATRDIRAGSIIVLGSVHMDYRMVSKIDCFSNLQQVLGRSSKRLLREGQALKISDLES